MPKRNFDGFRENDADRQSLDDGSLRAQRKQLERVLEHGKTKLFRALKLGRGFERQKLGRRQKIAKESNANSEMARLSAEVAALKVGNSVATARPKRQNVDFCNHSHSNYML